MCLYCHTAHGYVPTQHYRSLHGNKGSGDSRNKQKQQNDSIDEIMPKVDAIVAFDDSNLIEVGFLSCAALAMIPRNINIINISSNSTSRRIRSMRDFILFDQEAGLPMIVEVFLEFQAVTHGGH